MGQLLGLLERMLAGGNLFMIASKHGDIWEMESSHLLVIPTNIGWRPSGNHANVMGKGLALQAAKKYPSLPVWYGAQCMFHGTSTPVVKYPHAPLLLFPVKPLNQDQPWMSWKSKASLGLIEHSARQLSELMIDHPIAVSMVGCGAGGLEMAEVRPILDKYLSDARFTLVLFGE